MNKFDTVDINNANTRRYVIDMLRQQQTQKSAYIPEIVHKFIAKYCNMYNEKYNDIPLFDSLYPYINNDDCIGTMILSLKSNKTKCMPLALYNMMKLDITTNQKMEIRDCVTLRQTTKSESLRIILNNLPVSTDIDFTTYIDFMKVMNMTPDSSHVIDVIKLIHNIKYLSLACNYMTYINKIIKCIDAIFDMKLVPTNDIYRAVIESRNIVMIHHFRVKYYMDMVYYGKYMDSVIEAHDIAPKPIYNTDIFLANNKSYAHHNVNQLNIYIRHSDINNTINYTIGSDMVDRIIEAPARYFDKRTREWNTNVSTYTDIYYMNNIIIYFIWFGIPLTEQMNNEISIYICRHSIQYQKFCKIMNMQILDGDILLDNALQHAYMTVVTWILRSNIIKFDYNEIIVKYIAEYKYTATPVYTAICNFIIAKCIKFTDRQLIDMGEYIQSGYITTANVEKFNI